MPDTIYPYTRDVIREGMWVQKRNKQGQVISLYDKSTKVRIRWSHTRGIIHMRLYTTTVDSKYLKPIKPII